ncbi:helix-turn-helix domain-containing protein [Eoetvoesiella caeni]
MQTKIMTVYETLQKRSLNRFEAERIGDHCLHSTIAVLRADGHKIYSQWEVVETRFKPTRVKRYFLLRGTV